MSKACLPCPECSGNLRAVQYADVGGTKTMLTTRKYCKKCDKIFKVTFKVEN